MYEDEIPHVDLCTAEEGIDAADSRKELTIDHRVYPDASHLLQNVDAVAPHVTERIVANGQDLLFWNDSQHVQHLLVLSETQDVERGLWVIV